MRSVSMKITLQTGSPDHPETDYEDNLSKGTLLGGPYSTAKANIELLCTVIRLYLLSVGFLSRV